MPSLPRADPRLAAVARGLAPLRAAPAATLAARPLAVALGLHLREAPAPSALPALTTFLWRPARPVAPSRGDLKRLVYSSRAVGPMTTRVMAELLDDARERNAQAEITGLLLHHEGGLIQCIEEPVATVEALYTRIVRDPRHRYLVLLCDERIEKRVFTSWYMAHGEISARTWVTLCAAPWLSNTEEALAQLVQTWNRLRLHPGPGVFAEAGPPGY